MNSKLLYLAAVPRTCVNLDLGLQLAIELMLPSKLVCISKAGSYL